MHAIDKLTGAAVGAGLMYVFDPELGERRRAAIQDQFHEVINETSQYFNDRFMPAFQGGQGGGSDENDETETSATARLVTGAAGGVLMLNCALSNTLISKVLGTVGLGLVTCAVRNSVPFAAQAKTGRPQERLGQRGKPQRASAGANTPEPHSESAQLGNRVDEAIDESFPASDPPSYSGSSATPGIESMHHKHS